MGNSASTPSSNGMIAFQGQTSDPTGADGNIYYSNSSHQFKYHNGTAWQTMGGSSGITYTYYCFTTSRGGSPVCTDAGGSQGYCPSGYTQKASLGKWGYCHGYDALGLTSWLLPPGGSCGPINPYGDFFLGSAYVCSQ